MSPETIESIRRVSWSVLRKYLRDRRDREDLEDLVQTLLAWYVANPDKAESGPALWTVVAYRAGIDHIRKTRGRTRSRNAVDRAARDRAVRADQRRKLSERAVAFDPAAAAEAEERRELVRRALARAHPVTRATALALMEGRPVDGPRAVSDGTSRYRAKEAVPRLRVLLWRASEA